MFCKNCGFSLKDGTRFCPNCGARVEQVSSEQPAAFSQLDDVGRPERDSEPVQLDRSEKNNGSGFDAGIEVNKQDTGSNIHMDYTMQMPYTKQTVNNQTMNSNSAFVNGQPVAGVAAKNKRKNKKLKYVIISLLAVLVLALGVVGGIVLKNNLHSGNIKSSLEAGNNYISQNKFSEAKTAYQKAIDLDKGNKDTYLKIRDEYVKAGRLDDAYYIIKLAKQNGVADMDAQLKDIEGKFQVEAIEDTASQNQDYALPMDVTLKLNGEEEVKAAVDWNKGAVNTSKVGTFEFAGVAKDYGRPVKLTLKVIAKISSVKGIMATVNQGEEYKLPEKVTAVMSDKSTVDMKVTWSTAKVDTSQAGVQKIEGTVSGYSPKVILTLTIKPKQTVSGNKMGYIKKVYEENGKKYIQVDEVEWYTGDQAIEEAKKDGNAEKDENGQYFVPDDYYMRDNTHDITTYEVTDSTVFKLLDLGGASVSAKVVTYDAFKTASVSGTSVSGSQLLCSISISNNIVTNIEEQYRP
ncbi:MAG: Ig-like domain-containing protein [Bacillota bacterium]|nr:Ig-like domain-containing protein [Bacillota bacterium]